MPRKGIKQKPLPVSAVNQKCKEFLLRQCVIISFALSAMAYFLPYEQPNASTLPQFDLTVMSLNIRNARLDHADSTKWESRRDVTRAMLDIYSPDIIGIQEAENDQIDAIKKSSFGYESFGSYPATSILFNKDRFRLIDGGTLWLSESPQIAGSISWDAQQERVLTWILISDIRDTQCIVNGDESDDEKYTVNEQQSFLVFNTHLDHRGEHSRFKSCGIIKDTIHEIAIEKFENRFPALVTGDFNAAKYGKVWKCLTENEDNSVHLKDTLHSAQVVGRFKENQLQYTFHGYLGLAMNTWYMRTLQYIGFGFSDSVVKWLRDSGLLSIKGVCCNAPNLYRQVFRRKKFDGKAGIHHMDWILWNEHEKIEGVEYFEVVTYHQLIDKENRSQIKWTLKGILYDRVVGKSVYPSDHFPVFAAFKLRQT